ncbi:hypothetical protein [Streptomyces sp. NBC_01716]|uniref:hypothetical protein n=1 Tax=Streptomyces sp. NBC_01716 TaxID=2975917 RepID=UPI002E326C5E|nr:hypothetical protein [Streptomyces sp. NBC_01716]
MADSTDDRVGREWQEGGGSGHEQAVIITPEARAEKAWHAYLTHIAEECKSTCRTDGVDCSQAVELKAAWNEAKRAA